MKSTLLTALALLFVSALVYSQFLFGDAVLLYTDIGSDSFTSYYADFVNLSRYVRAEGYPSWSFAVGMGQDLAYATGYLLWQPVSWLPQSWIAGALVFQHLCKVLVVGLLFFRFLKLRGRQWPAPLLGSLLLSFSAYMSMGACWYPLVDEVVAFVALLLGVEEAIQRGRWLLLAVAVALVGMINPFFLYLAALFLCCYVPLRLFGEFGWQPRMIFGASLRLSAVATLGLSLGAIVTMPYLYAILQSPRGSGITSATGSLHASGIFGLESARHYWTLLLRPFANDMLGKADEFRGWQNYLEAPLTYSGLICFVLLPHTLGHGLRRRRFLYCLLMAALLIPSVFPWFRYLFWLFQGDYYRTYSLFWILGVITLSMIAFSRYAAGGALNLWLLATTTVVVTGVLYLPVPELQALIDPNTKRAATLYLVSYAIVLATGQLFRRQKLAAYLIVGLAAVELVQFNRITVSHRQTVGRTELRDKLGDNDGTVAALRDLRSDDDGVFRLTKPQSSPPAPRINLNDAMLFGYYGTSSYSSFNNANYTGFLTAVSALPAGSEVDTRWSVGLLNDPVLSTFAGEKYALVEEPSSYQGSRAYEFVRQYGKLYLFRNNLSLPLGITFTRYLSEEAFAQLPAEEKPEVLMRAVVLANGSEGNRTGLSPTTAAELESEINHISLPDAIAARRETALHLTSFRQTRMTGNVRLDQKSVMVVQMPFDPGWHAFQDRQAAPIVRADVGLLGVALDAGEHQVELRYSTPYLPYALTLSLAALLVTLFCFWRWPRFRPSA